MKTKTQYSIGLTRINLLLAGWLTLVTPLRADDTPTYLFEINTNAVPGGFAPEFVVLDASNNVYVSDNQNHRVVKFTAGGIYLAQTESVGGGSIAVDSMNYVYLVDSTGIAKFDSNGTYLTHWNSIEYYNLEFYGPIAVAVDSSNNVYVANLDVNEYDSNGNFLTQWVNHYGNSDPYIPDGLAVDSDGNVYVS